MINPARMFGYSDDKSRKNVWLCLARGSRPPIMMLSKITNLRTRPGVIGKKWMSSSGN